MKMVEHMEDEVLLHLKGEIRNRVTHKHHASYNSGCKGRNKHKWGQGKLKFHDNMEKMPCK
jgi:hypothetical protein